MNTRRRKKRKKSWLSFLFFLIVVLLAGTGIYYLSSLPLWQIRQVEVQGTNLLSPTEIKNLSGIPLGENLFWADLSRARENLKKISAIKKSRLYRIPPGTVLISLEERQPLAVVVLQGRSLIIDQDGYIINRNQSLTLALADQINLPVISSLSGEQLVGEGERLNPQSTALINQVISQLSELLGSRRLKLQIAGFSRISFLLDDILLVKVGRDEEIALKLSVFKRLLPVVANKWEKVEYIDVRYPNNPVIKFK